VQMDGKFRQPEKESDGDKSVRDRQKVMNEECAKLRKKSRDIGVRHPNDQRITDRKAEIERKTNSLEALRNRNRKERNYM
jgi:hypothetical protein